MRFYLIYTKEGQIIETADAGYGFEFNIREIKYNYPNEKVIEISEEEYEKIKDDLLMFKIVNGEIKEKTLQEKLVINNLRKKWQEENTIQGLRKKVEQLENKLK